MPLLVALLLELLLVRSVVSDAVDQLLQYKTLKEFYDSTNGPQWRNNSGWLDGPPCGKDWRLPGNTPWHGLICNLNNGVTNINLINHQLKGTIPDSFFTGLQDIQRVNIGQNQLSGTIPKTICAAPWLMTFTAQLNRGLGGRLPECMATIPYLEELILEMTSVTGTIPTQTYPKIKVLILSNSKFYGTIPNHWQSMAELKVLALNGCSGIGSNPSCKLRGTIPQSMYTLNQLFLWSLQQNMLNGTLGNFQDMKKLREVHFNDNKLTGEVPGSIYGQFAKPVIRENATRGMFHVENNKLTGRLLRSMEHFQYMKEIGIYNNMFTGYPPKCLYDYTQKDSEQKWGEKWEIFPTFKDSLAKIPWLPGLASWAVKMGAKSHPFQVNHIQPPVMDTPIVHGNGSYYGPEIHFIGTGFVELIDELRCAFFRADIKVKLGDPCNGVPPGSPDGVADCVKTLGTLVNSTHIKCKPVNMPGILGAVQAALVYDGDDLSDVKNVTHVISNPKTMVIYDPFPIIKAISPRSGRIQGCTTVTISGKHFVDTKQIACWFNETRVNGTYISNNTITCVSPPLWDPELVDVPFNVYISPNNGQSFAVNSPEVQIRDLTFSYFDYCDLSPHNSLRNVSNCECGMCPCSSFGMCILNASMLPGHHHQDTDDFVLSASVDTSSDEDKPVHYPFCFCLPGFTGGNCSDCSPGFYGDNCDKCDCDHGACQDGRDRDGRCSCQAWWSGKRCDYFYKPLVMEVSAFMSGILVVALLAWLKTRKPAVTAAERAPLVSAGSGNELYTTSP